MSKKYNDYKNSYSNNKNKKSDYSKDKNFEQKKVLQEIRTISTSTSKESGERKKIQIIPRIKIFSKGENQNINVEKSGEKNKKIITVNSSGKVNKNDFKFKSKIPRHIVPYKPATLEAASCPICNKIINNMSNSIKDITTEIPCHFECVVTELKKKVQVRQNQRIAYVGGGSFAVIEDVREDGRNKFIIIQKLQYSSEKV